MYYATFDSVAYIAFNVKENWGEMEKRALLSHFINIGLKGGTVSTLSVLRFRTD